jgi:allantoicase
VINEPIDLLVDLAADRVGGMVIAANDDFFAPKENLVKDSAPVSKPGEYTARGKWMDGWETRRRREPGHDWAIIRLGLRGIIRHVVVDTSHFTGNFPEACSIEAIDLPGEPDLVELARDPTRWATLVDREVLRGDAINDFPIVDDAAPVSHVRLVIFPDGGVARLRVLGDPAPPDGLLSGDEEVDLAALHSGARVIDCSDRHYSSPNRMLLPGRSQAMWDGWETKRRRGPGNDWAVIRLAGRGDIASLEVDTTHFKGNAPGSTLVEAIDASPDVSLGDLRFASWATLLPETPLTPDKRHRFDDLEPVGPATHLRVNIHPDGGLARFRAFGTSDTPWTSRT